MTEFAFDDMTGSLLVGQEAMDLHLQRGGTFIPLPQVLLEKSFPYEDRAFPCRQTTWSNDELVHYGQWVYSMVTEVNASLTLRTPHLKRLGALGVGPAFGLIEGRFDTVRNFKTEIGAPMRYSRGQYTDWGRSEFVAYAQRLHSDITEREGRSRKLVSDDILSLYQADKGPSYVDIQRHDVGGGR